MSNNKQRAGLGLAAWIGLLGPMSLHAEPGLTAATTLQKPLGARAIAMGEAYVAADGGVDSMGYNPAGLLSLKRPVLETTYTNGLANDNFSFTGYAHPLPLGTISAGAIYYDAGTIQLNLSDGTNENRKAQQDLVGLMGLSVPLGESLAAGMIAKFYRLELAQEARATGYAADAGLLWHSPLMGLNFGASIQNMGPNVKFEQEGDPLPLTTRFGAAYLLDLKRYGMDLPAFTQFQFTADGVKVKDDKTSAGIGLEMAMALGESGRAALRFGYIFNQDLDSLTLGMGFKESRFFFDYALGIKSEINNVHNFSLGILF